MVDMSKPFRRWDVDQQWLLPRSVHEFVPAGHAAHLIRDAVRETLDLSGIYESYEGTRGQPPYHPGMMVALLLYAYSCGVYSSRRIARGCEERVDFMAVSGLERPDFRTISDFRKRHLVALAGLFKQVLGLCRRAGLVKLGHVSLDGTKIKANASKRKAMSYGRMVKAEAKLAAEVRGWLEQAEAEDAAEDGEHGREVRGDEMPGWVADKEQRLARIREAKEALEAEARDKEDKGRPGKSAEGEAKPAEKAQRNFTDPQSRILKTGDGFIQGYNAQAVADAGHQVIVAHGVTESGSDQKQLEPMVEAIQEETGGLPKQLSADAGYGSEANLEILEGYGIRGYVATGRQKHGSAAAVGAKGARAGSLREAMSRRLKQGGRRSRYRLRKVTIEPVFGQIKHARGFRQFLLRGLDQVRHEWALVCMAHNLNKLAVHRAARQAVQA